MSKQWVPCGMCGGSGVVDEYIFSTSTSVCPRCRGLGEIRVRLEDEHLALVAGAVPDEETSEDPGA